MNLNAGGDLLGGLVVSILLPCIFYTLQEYVVLIVLTFLLIKFKISILYR